jgi:hypothetical protein
MSNEPGFLFKQVDLLICALGFVIAILSCYEALRAIAGKGVNRRALLMLACGVLAATIQIGTSIFLYSSSVRLAVQMRGVPLVEPAKGWEVGQTPKEITDKSRLLAWHTFSTSGTLIEYVDLNGKKVLFTPSQQDINDREALVLATQKIVGIRDTHQSSAYFYLLCLCFALALGWYSGRSIRA